MENGLVMRLKMDIKRFFDTINHEILKTLIRKNIQDRRGSENYRYYHR